jgi:3,4-dihydroxy 2-butanone 4-phosphate synthase
MSRSSDTAGVRRGADDAVAAFAAGEPVLIHDAADREGEVDLVYPAAAVSPRDVARMRNDAGGLVCVALPDLVCETWGLPFVQGTVDHPAAENHDLSYDDRSSFSLTVNHRDTHTGITDEDRALTVSSLAEAAAAPGDTDFGAQYRAPGHVHLLRAAEELLDGRQGHTELGVALAEAAGVPRAVVVCEMLDGETGGALAPRDAADYATRHGFPYIEGAQLVDQLG